MPYLGFGLVVPLTYAAGVTGVAVVLAGDQPAGVRVRVPLVLAAMHMSWGAGYLTSPRRLATAALDRGGTAVRQYNAAMGFDLGAELSAVRGQGYDLHSKYLNPQLPRTLRTIGFDKDYVRGEGAYLYDAEGNAYADFLAGFGVFAAGRSHPVIKKALHDALDMDFAAWTQFDCQPIAGLLAQRLIAKTPGLDRVFFCSSGTEAVESALKFARHATGKGRIIYAHHGFHGLTAGSLSVNGAEEFKRGFGPLLPGTEIPLGDLAALEAELRKGDVAAMIIEPVQGHGVMMPPAGFLPEATALLHKHGALLICDEVQAGLGPHRQVLLLPVRGRPAGHRHRGQGAVRRLRADRRDADHGQDLLLGLLLDGQAHGPLDHLQGRSAGDGGRARVAGRHRGRGPGRERRAARAPS